MKLIRYHNSPRYTPFPNYATMHNEIDRLFDASFSGLGTLQQEFPVDLYQEKEAFVVRAELPGFRKEDLAVEVADGVLTLSGHRKTDASTDKEKASSMTTQERQVSRAISLPEHVQVDKIQATYENGVLTVRLPKTEEVKPKQIAIEVK